MFLVSEVLTQGRATADTWPSQFELQYLDPTKRLTHTTAKDGDWTPVQNAWTGELTFAGSTDRNTPAHITCFVPFEAQYVRLLSRKSWVRYQHLCLRWDVVGVPVAVLNV